jgi:imidazolonepropionase-like amidohydrolase
VKPTASGDDRKPAEIFGAADELGSIEAGKSADLVVFDGNPLTGPARLKTVVIQGRVE